MAEIKQARREPSRLQKIAPELLQINRVMDWNVAIPLLSPLITSPDRPVDISFASCVEDMKDAAKKNGRDEGKVAAAAAAASVVVFRKWQHPAAPFCYESAPLMPFVCSSGVDR